MVDINVVIETPALGAILIPLVVSSMLCYVDAELRSAATLWSSKFDVNVLSHVFGISVLI